MAGTFDPFDKIAVKFYDIPNHFQDNRRHSYGTRHNSLFLNVHVKHSDLTRHSSDDYNVNDWPRWRSGYVIG